MPPTKPTTGHVSIAIALGLAALCMPGRALADEPTPRPVPQPPNAYLSAPPAPPGDRASALAQPEEGARGAGRTRVPRIGFETIGALLGLGSSVIVGVLGWGLSGALFCQSPESRCATDGALVMGAISSLLLVPLGVIVGSRATRGNGGYLWSVLGAALGIVPGIAAGVWLTQETGDVLSAVPALAALTIFGAVLGYELSADAPPTATERLFTPLAFVDAHSLRLGVRGSL